MIAIILCVLFWGFSFISTKIAIIVFPPMSLAMLRFAIALVFLYFIKLKLAPNEKPRLKDIPLLLTAGLTGVTLYFYFENNGIALVSASEASIAISSIPALTMITEMIAGKITKKDLRPAAFRQWIGCLVSITGVWLVAGVSFSISGNVTGYIFMTGAALSWVAYSFLTRPLFAHCSRIYIVFWQTAAGFVFFLPFTIIEFSCWGKADIEVIAHVVFLGIFCSALGYWFYVRAMEDLGVSVCAIFINLIPVVTVIFGFFLLGDRLTPLQWIGAALVVSGVYLAIYTKSAKRK
ncbi:MAG: DMT family transporter [Treponema sp.]|nr:DMT family transporter [Treponema sp.]